MIQDGTARAVALSEGRMTIAGVSGRFVQGIGRHLRLEAEHLRIVTGYANAAGSLRENARIEGSGRIDGDGLARAGFDGAAGAITLVLRPFPTGGEARILLSLGYREEDASYFAELWAPPTLFDALKRDILAGAAQHLTLSATTSLWVREEERETSPALPVTWYLGPEADGRRSTNARGLVETLDWTHLPGQPVVETAPAAMEDEEPPEDPVAEQVRRLNWSLKQLVLVLAFLLIVVAMK